MAKNRSKTIRLRGGLVTGVIIFFMAAAIVLIQLAGSAAPPANQRRMTLEPQIITNLTQLPQATPLSGEAATQISSLKALVDACPDYTAERRDQMAQHLEWLQNPATIPPDIIIALGGNPVGRLIYGMASYTSIQWRLNERPPDSCLLPIAELLNQMLTAAGEEPFPLS
jgi:hypothetical protein